MRLKVILHRQNLHLRRSNPHDNTNTNSWPVATWVWAIGPASKKRRGGPRRTGYACTAHSPHPPRSSLFPLSFLPSLKPPNYGTPEPQTTSLKWMFGDIFLYPTLMAYTGCALDFLVTKRVFWGAGLYKSRNLPKKTLNKISTKSTAQPTCPGAPVPYFITRKSLGQPLLPKRYHCKNI